MAGCVIVTGASGFIGRALVAALASAEAKVTAVSRRSWESSPGVRAYRVADYGETPCPPDAVLVHLAEASLIDAADEASAARNMTALLDKGFERLVYASSAAVYEGRAGSMQRPDDPVRGRNAYTRAKLANEAHARAAGGVVLRTANVYGPGMRHETLVAAVLAQIPGTGPLVIADMRSVRDFLWLDDAVAGFVAATLGEAVGTYNLGTGVGTAADALARHALELAGEGERPVVARTRPSDAATELVLDSRATEAAFGWRPRVSLDEGLQRLLAARR